MFDIRTTTENDWLDIRTHGDDRDGLFCIYPNGQYPFSLSQLLLSRQRKELTVVMESGKVIGFANLYNINVGHFAFIGNVVIDKSCRGWERPSSSTCKAWLMKNTI